MASFAQSIDPKKDDFRKYLERNGIIDALTKGEKVSYLVSVDLKRILLLWIYLNYFISSWLMIVLVGLYEEPEKPDSPVDYIKQFLGGPSDVDTEQLRQENEELKSRIEELQAKLDQLTASAEPEKLVQDPATV